MAAWKREWNVEWSGGCATKSLSCYFVTKSAFSFHRWSFSTSVTRTSGNSRPLPFPPGSPVLPGYVFLALPFVSFLCDFYVTGLVPQMRSVTFFRVSHSLYRLVRMLNQVVNSFLFWQMCIKEGSFFCVWVFVCGNFYNKNDNKRYNYKSVLSVPCIFECRHVILFNEMALCDVF